MEFVLNVCGNKFLSELSLQFVIGRVYQIRSHTKEYMLQ